MSSSSSIPRETKGLVLGLDLGTNSIGWALVEAWFTEDGRRTTEECLVACGVRVFPEGVRRDQGGERPLGQERRLHRQQRRRVARHRGRRWKLLAILRQHGLMPPDDEGFQRVMKLDPWALRARALDHPLEPFELGRVFYHLNQRRGFRSNRKDTTRRKEEGPIIKAISHLESQLLSTKARTLGEYLWKIREKDPAALLRGEERLRGRHISRSMIEAEFRLIVERQQGLRPGLLSRTAVQAIHDAIFFQRPFELTEERLQNLPRRANAWRSPKLGRCPLEPDEFRCALGTWHAQQFRMLKEINNLRIVAPDGRERELSPEERQRVVEYLSTKREATFARLARHLDLGAYDRFNLQAGDRTKIFGNEVEHQLQKAFGKRSWNALGNDQRDELRELLPQVADMPETHLQDLRERLESLGANPEKVGKLLGWTPPDGYLRFSCKAIRKLLPHLEQGVTEYDAIQREYPDARRDLRQQLAKLPPLTHVDNLLGITNPVVRRALVEIRKVLNAIVREYGLPREIVVELARDLKRNSRQRAELTKRMKARERIREEARHEAEKFGIAQPTRQIINRHVLWKEQNRQCIYTGQPISLADLWSPDGGIEVDHIIPRSRSLDNSLMNQVVCVKEANSEKGNRTPFEWLGDTEKFRNLLGRVEDCCKKSGMPWPKLNRFRQREIDDDFLNRQLTDTQFITRAVIGYLELLYPPERRGNVTGRAIRTTKGAITAQLRHAWGLDGLLDSSGAAYGLKTRDDHRHHTIDAIVVALSTPKRIHHFARSLQEHPRGRIAEPWESFRATVEEKVRNVVVSHRPTRRIEGGFHEETYYGKLDPSDNWYVSRQPLDSIKTESAAQRIVDPVIRELVFQRLREHQENKKEAFKKPLKMASGVVIKKVRVKKRIPGAVRWPARPTGPNNRFVKLGNNHHIAFYRKPDGNWTAEIVSALEAKRRILLGESVVRKEDRDGNRIVMALAKGDMVLLSDGSGKKKLHVLQKISTGSQTQPFYLQFRLSTDARTATQVQEYAEGRFVSFSAFRSRKPRKVETDLLGRIIFLPS